MSWRKVCVVSSAAPAAHFGDRTLIEASRQRAALAAPLQRGYYAKMARAERWSVRMLHGRICAGITWCYRIDAACMGSREACFEAAIARYKGKVMRKTKSHLSEAAQETARDLGSSGATDQVTLREFDQLSVPPVSPLKPDEIKRIREDSHVSQAVFARLLNTSLSTVQKWEIGQKRPAGTALKLLHLVQKRGLEIIAA